MTSTRGNPHAAARGLLSVAVLVAAGFALPAWSADYPYDFVACTHSRAIVLEAGPELTALGVEQWGVVSSSTTPQWERATTHCVGYTRVSAGKPVGKGVCKWFFANGDTGIGEFEIPPTGAPTWTWLAGTGGLKGIQGTGTFAPVFSGRPADAGTTQGCRRDWGTYTLP